jgi:hypothetical protein
MNCPRSGAKALERLWAPRSVEANQRRPVLLGQSELLVVRLVPRKREVGRTLCGPRSLGDFALFLRLGVAGNGRGERHPPQSQARHE